MTISPERRLLPLLSTGPHGSRSAMTCFYRCDNACDHPEPNPTDHETMRELVERGIARRSVLKAGAVGGGALVVGGLTSGTAPAAAAPRGPHAAPAISFEPVPPNVRDAVTVARGFDQRVVMSWGDAVLPEAPEFDVRNQTPQSAAAQFGYNCDYVGVVHVTDTDALLVVNHEYTNEELMFPPETYDADTQKRIAMASHGMSVVQIRRSSPRTGEWKRVSAARARLNRRITAHTRIRLDGPAAGDVRLRTSGDHTGTVVRGTLNNCAGGLTPWGTVLSGEENFNQYFDASGDLDERYAESYSRYGITGAGSRGWSSVEPRFDLTEEPHEPFRFGWVVEVDPTSPRSMPRKHTMLGRFKHEGANVAVAPNGQVAVYMGDDERGDYIYKFVSRDKMARGRGRWARKHNLTLLQHGILYVARLDGDGLGDDEYDGRGRWIPLTSDVESYVAGMSVSDVLIDTRLAADKVGPTKMDRPEDIEANPVNGRVYCALTNNSQRGSRFPVDEPNPLASSMVREQLGSPLKPASGNRNGYVLELAEERDRPTALTFRWKLLLVCGDPEAPETYFAGYPKDKVSPISCPDNVAFDPHGDLWISTDGNALGSNDGIFRVPLSGPERGRVAQYLTVPRGAEACGPLVGEDGRSVWVAVQHPGETDGATFTDPGSTWPHSHDFPRPSVVVTYRD